MKKTLLGLLLTLTFGFLTAQEVSFTIEEIGTTGVAERALVDMNGDHLDDIVGVNTSLIKIFYQKAEGGFDEVEIATSAADNFPSWSLGAADYDGNGYTDLLYGGGNGVTFMRANDDGTAFTEISYPQFVFSQRSNFVDINMDGNLDAFVCHDVEPNVYYINDGSGELTYIQGGLGDFATGGNYGSVWVDYDNDRDMDLFIAKCNAGGGGSEARRTNQMHTNNGDGTYTENAADLVLDDPMQTWSSAWGDFDNDGDMDAWVGASTFSEGFHRLMVNNGDNTFTDVIAGSGLEGFNVTGIENATLDFNNDGNLDIASNGSILLGNGDMTFTIQSNIIRATTAFGDVNNDGFIDCFAEQSTNTNVPGELRINNGNSNNWLKVATIGTDSNLDGIGARVEIVTPSGTQIRDVRSGEGFRFMSSMNTHFGIGTDTEITSVTIYWPSGNIDTYDDVPINDTLIATEKETLGLEDTLVENLILYPNPTKDVLNLGLNGNMDNVIYTVFDINGKRVMNGRLDRSVLDVSSLISGNYFLRILQEGNIMTQRFVKQ
ncbi:FG-GAP-like repeat-containing protein [Aureitalea marina]|uniref:RNA-binding protein n=1 Tax=Aureitalea marina TaxID=930804 RepID=A0A2S7KS23_9FLAO|nr:FG-GAP-like repeat-containing protein [Aureitalea marina]PQB05416.1 hypothetical protein BST85_11330 [Aureitalea marina]